MEKNTNSITLEVNGQKKEFNGDPQMPLLWYLRDVLGLTGTKFGCGKGLCGSCTLHLDGNPIRSCSFPMVAATGKKITTIEEFSVGAGAPLCKAWIEEEVAQCGYCQPGQIMNAGGLLAQNPQATESQIEQMMSGNICRCGSYPRIKKAINRCQRNGGIKK